MASVTVIGDKATPGVVHAAVARDEFAGKQTKVEALGEEEGPRQQHQHQEEEEEEERHQWTYASKPGESSMYRAVEAVLKARPDWRKTTSAVHYNLLLAERWKVPYARLGRDTALRQAVNHQRGSKGITVKGLMVKALRAHCDVTPGVVIGDFIPETHLVVPGEPANAAERVNLLSCASAPEPEPEAWICKPTTGAHGGGIHIAETAAEAVSHIDASAPVAPVDDENKKQKSDPGEEASKPKLPVKPWLARRGGGGGAAVKPRATAASAWLVQRYIARPMLLSGRKFDIRAFALVAHDGAVHFYDDWIVRTCSVPFDMTDLANRTAHISNHCVQVESDAYGAHEEGNEIFAADMLAYLERTYPEPMTTSTITPEIPGTLRAPSPPEQLGGGGGGGAEGRRTATTTTTTTRGRWLYDGIVAQMRMIAAHTVASVAESLGGDDAYDSFQLLGYDFMPDEDGKVWLLEVNGSPAAAERMTPSIASDVVELAIDNIFPPVGVAEDAERLRATVAGAADGGRGGANECRATASQEERRRHPRWTDISNLADKSGPAGENENEAGPATPPKVVL